MSTPRRKDRRPPSARLIAAQVIHRVLDEGAYSHLALDSALGEVPRMPVRDRALATELVYGTLTWIRRLDGILSKYVKRGLHKVDPEVRAVLRVAIYQIDRLDRIPERAAVHEAVESAQRWCGRSVGGFVNGVLRAALRDRAGWVSAPGPEVRTPKAMGQRWSLPDWLTKVFIDELGWDDAEKLAEAMTQRPALSLRAIGPETREALAAELEGRVGELAETALVAPGMSAELKEILDSGRAVVQDEAAQLVGHLVAPGPGDRILDGCAGLGGKAAHLAALAGAEASLTVVDNHVSKLDVLARTFESLGLPKPTARVGDLRELEDLGQFERVLVDAPCTGLGVMRRHPEVRWRRGPEDIASLSALQGSLLARAADLVAPGGALIFSTCTITRAEGDAQIETLLASRPDLSVDRPEGELWSKTLRQTPLGWLLLPSETGTDGFYMSRLVRGT